MKVYLQKNAGQWIGADAEEDAKWARIVHRMKKARPGEALELEIKRPRSLTNHRRGMSLLRYVFEAQDRYRTMEDLLVEMKLRCGHYDEHITLQGEIVLNPRSICFAEMDEDSFLELYPKMVQAAIDCFLPIMNKGDAVAHLENIARF